MKKNKFQIKREATYAKLIQAGVEVFCEKGYSGASIDDIVMRAGYTKGAFYVHFESKEHFFLELLQVRKEENDQFFASIAQMIQPGVTLAEVSLGVATSFLSHLEKYPEWPLVYVDFYNLAKNNETILKIYRDFYQERIEDIASFLTILKNKQLLPADIEIIEKAKCLYAYIDGCMLHYNLYQELIDPKVMSNTFLNILQAETSQAELSPSQNPL